jgi:hypothetical protein
MAGGLEVEIVAGGGLAGEIGLLELLADRSSAVRAFVRLAGQCGLISWKLEVPGVRGRRRRDVRGPVRGVYLWMVGEASGHLLPTKAARDAALLVLMGDLGFRVAEVLALNVDVEDIEAQQLTVQRKGSTAHLLGGGPPLAAVGHSPPL